MDCSLASGQWMDHHQSTCQTRDHEIYKWMIGHELCGRLSRWKQLFFERDCTPLAKLQCTCSWVVNLSSFPFVRTGRSDRPVRKCMIRASYENCQNWFWPNWPCPLSRASQFSRSCTDYSRNGREFCRCRRRRWCKIISNGIDSATHTRVLARE